MNTKKIPYDSAKQTIYANIKELYAINETFDLVIVEDAAALDCALEYKKKLFDRILIVFMEINTVEKANLAHGDPLITGMVEFFPYHETIALATQMYPKATKIVGISDNSDSGQGCTERFLMKKLLFHNWSLRRSTHLIYPKKELVKQLAELDASTILVFLALVNDNACIPMFKSDMNGIGMGVLGGYVSSYEDMGKLLRRRPWKFCMELLRLTLQLTPWGISALLL